MKQLFHNTILARVKKQATACYAPFIAASVAAICAPAAYAVVPNPPTGVFTVSGNARIAVNWTPPSGTLTKYYIYRGPTSGSETYLTYVAAPAVKFTDTPLPNGQTFYYQVSAVNSSGEGPRSSEVFGTTLAVSSAPSSLTATGHTGQVALSWPAATGTVTRYTIFRGTTSTGETLLSTPVIMGTSYTHTNVTNGTKYYCQVAGLNSSGTGGKSPEASATPVDRSRTRPHRHLHFTIRLTISLRR